VGCEDDARGSRWLKDGRRRASKASPDQRRRPGRHPYYIIQSLPSWFDLTSSGSRLSNGEDGGFLVAAGNSVRCVEDDGWWGRRWAPPWHQTDMDFGSTYSGSETAPSIIAHGPLGRTQELKRRKSRLPPAPNPHLTVGSRRWRPTGRQDGRWSICVCSAYLGR
jgi:hypothetical protein